MSTHGIQVGSRVQIVGLVTQTSPDVKGLVGHEGTVGGFGSLYLSNDGPAIEYVMVRVDGDTYEDERGFFHQELLLVEG